MSKCLIFDSDGQHIGYDGEAVGEATFSNGEMEHLSRIKISRITWLDEVPPVKIGYNDWTRDEVVRAQAAANDALMRDNAKLAADLRVESEVNESLTRHNVEIRRENEKLCDDVKRAESRYETADKLYVTYQAQLMCVTSILDGTYDPQAPCTWSPLADLARQVMKDFQRARAESTASQFLRHKASSELEEARATLEGIKKLL